MLKAICHARATADWEPVEDLSTLSDLMAASGNVLWVEANVADVTDEDLKHISEEFGLHPLAVEDALNARQRPKLEQYEGHLFAVLHQLDGIEGQLEAVQIACFIGRRYVLSLHAGAERTIEAAKKRWAGAPEDLSHGVAFLMHTLMDTLVDDYQAIADEIESRIEELEEIVLAVPNAPIERDIYAVKQKLSRFRRYALPAARVLDAVVAPEDRFALIPPDTAAYFRDIHDHILRITDQIRNISDLGVAVVELHRSAQTQALNEVTKKLTGWGAIIAVPTFIASVFGMNFRFWPFREGSVEGYATAIGLMAVAGLGLYAYFKRRTWI